MIQRDFHHRVLCSFVRSGLLSAWRSNGTGTSEKNKRRLTTTKKILRTWRKKSASCKEISPRKRLTLPKLIFSFVSCLLWRVCVGGRVCFINLILQHIYALKIHLCSTFQCVHVSELFVVPLNDVVWPLAFPVKLEVGKVVGNTNVDLSNSGIELVSVY